MEFGIVLEFLKESVILVTGGAGFLAKVFLEKVLRVQPNVKKLYVLLRASDSKSALLRFQNEILSKDLFTVLKERHGADFGSWISERVVAVSGDVSLENLGIKESSILHHMLKEVEVVVHVAANIRFTERYDVSFQVNTLGAKHVLDFSKGCINLQALVHVSTAYACGEKAGRILERPLKMREALNGSSRLDIDYEKNLIDETIVQLRAENAPEQQIKSYMRNLGTQRAREHGWPNTYVFTKAMGEMLIGDLKGNLPVVIVRPTIVTSTYMEPFPGWLDVVGTIDGFNVPYGKGKLEFFPGDPNTILDLIPVDMVVNAMLVATVKHANEGNSAIYQIGSSARNPFILKMWPRYSFRYFTSNPLIDAQGRPIRVHKCRLINSMKSLHMLFNMKYTLPLKCLQIINTISFGRFDEAYRRNQRNIDSLSRLMHTFKPYLFFKGCFDDTNTENLRRAMREADAMEKDLFCFDPKVIDWEEYAVKIHLPGLVRHVMK